MKFRKEMGNILTAKTLYVLLPILGWSVHSPEKEKEKEKKSMKTKGIEENLFVSGPGAMLEYKHSFSLTRCCNICES